MALYTLAPQPWLIFLDDAGLYVPNGQLAIYAAGTMTPATVYTTHQGTPHPFPITLDSAGRVPGGLYLQPGLSYKFVLHEPQVEEPLDGGIIRSQDHVAASAAAGPLGGSILNISVAGDYSNINVSGVRLIEYGGSGDVTFRGFVGGVPGQQLVIKNLTSHTVWLYDQDGLAPVGGSLVNFVNSGPTPLAGVRGTASYTYLSSQRWGIDAHSQGAPLPGIYNTVNYGTRNPGVTWTVEANDFFSENFYLEGRTLFYSFSLINTTIAGGETYALTRLLPAGYQMDGVTSTNIIVSYGGPAEAGLVAFGDGTHLAFQRLPLTTNWVPGVNNVNLQGQIAVAIH